MQDYQAKIAGLLAKAERTDNPQEAEAYSAKAERLMVKWNIDAAMVAEAAHGQQPKPEAIVHKRIITGGVTYGMGYLMLGYHTVLGMGTMDAYRTRTGNKHVLVIVGYESDVDRANMLVTSLMLQAQTAQRAWWRTLEDKQYLTKRESEREKREFLAAFGRAVKGRLVETRMDEDAAQASTGGTELVVRSRRQRVEDYMAEEHPHMRKAQGPQAGSSVSRRAGRAAGEKANLGQTGISGGAKQVTR